MKNRNRNINRSTNIQKQKTELKTLKFSSPVHGEDFLNLKERYVNDKDLIVTNGYNNSYANFLLYLKENCGDHDSILKGKANMIMTEGFRYKGSSESLNVKVNNTETLYDVTFKALQDYLVFNFFCIEVLYNSFGQPVEYYHVPAHKIATNINKTRFEFRDNWGQGMANSIFYDAFSPYEKSETSKLFMYCGEMGSGIVYPSVEYSSIIIPALTDIAISKFNLNNIKNHFSVSSIISFFNGTNQSVEDKTQIDDMIKNLYSGENGEKVLLSFNNPDEKGIEVQNISANDWDKAYVEVSKNVSEKIQVGHSIVSPMLFGIKTEGQLGGATEMDIAYQIFQFSEGKQKRRELTNAFNYLFQNSSIIEQPIEFCPAVSPFAQDEPIADKKQYMTVNEIRKEKGLPPIKGGDSLSDVKQETIINEE